MSGNRGGESYFLLDNICYLLSGAFLVPSSPAGNIIICNYLLTSSFLTLLSIFFVFLYPFLGWRVRDRIANNKEI